MPGAVFLEGDKVELRTIEKEDIEFLQENINKKEIRKNLTATKPVNLNQQKNFFEDVISSDKDVHLAICNEGEIMGIISLEDEEGDIGAATIGLWIAPKYHGNGYGTESVELITGYGFNELNYHRISARAYETNKASQKVWEKLGFEKEGELREKTFYGGEFGDIYIYGVLEDEWRS
jgi:RimJ/RimL family protein N-acetyltransferase